MRRRLVIHPEVAVAWRKEPAQLFSFRQSRGDDTGGVFISVHTQPEGIDFGLVTIDHRTEIGYSVAGEE